MRVARAVYAGEARMLPPPTLHLCMQDQASDRRTETTSKWKICPSVSLSSSLNPVYVRSDRCRRSLIKRYMHCTECIQYWPTVLSVRFSR
jgi:hypothetical protein